MSILTHSLPAGVARAVVALPASGRAFVTRVTALPIMARGEGRLVHIGPAMLDDEAGAHVRDDLVPMADRVLSALGVACHGWELAVAPLDAAAVTEIPVAISGHSADFPIFLAMLSGALALPVRGDVVFTGALAGASGRAVPVGSLPAKIRAVLDHGEAGELVYPAFQGDCSLDSLAGTEAGKIGDAMLGARHSLRMETASGVGDLVRLAFSEADLVMSALRNGYYGLEPRATRAGGEVRRAADHLACPPERFWTALRGLAPGRGLDRLAEMLALFLLHHARVRVYPRDAGKRLMQFLLGIPGPWRASLPFPLVTLGACIAAGQHAGEGDADDFCLLIGATRGRFQEPAPGSASRAESGPPGDPDGVSGPASLDFVLDQLSAEGRVRSITGGLDAARASFSLDFATTASRECFLETLVAFYLRLMAGAGVVVDTSDRAAVEAEAMACAEEAFAREGGVRAAQTEAELGLRGGMRHILDAMTEHAKRAMVRNHVLRTLETAMDERDWPAQVAFMAALLGRLGPLLPPGIRQAPPEQYAAQWRTLALAVVESMDTSRQAFRRL